MFRVLVFLAKITLLVVAIVWVLERPGKIAIEWQGYLVETTVGVVIGALAILLLVWTLAYRFWRSVVSMPEVLKRYRWIKTREKGYQAITRGLVAIAAGDAVAAQRYADKANKMVPDTPLAGLLRAQSALLGGNVPKARREFMQLLDDEEATFFGVRGLLAENLKEGNYGDALDLMRRADHLQPKRHWVIRTLFDLETRQREWQRAEKTLNRAKKLRVFDPATALSHQQCLWLAMAEEYLRDDNVVKAARYAQKSFSLDKSHTPSALVLVRALDRLGKQKKAVHVIEQAWKLNPHPDLSDLWARHMPKPSKKKKANYSPYEKGEDAYKWMQRLYTLSPDHRLSAVALGRAALEARHYKEARELLTMGVDYRGLAKLEHLETGDDVKARQWLERAADAPPDYRWVCQHCGAISLDWAALCHDCGSFNAYEWVVPSPVTTAIGHPPDEGDSFLMPPSSS